VAFHETSVEKSEAGGFGFMLRSVYKGFGVDRREQRKDGEG
jgi:hypothetical protein